MARDYGEQRPTTWSLATAVLLLPLFTLPLRASAADISKARAWALSERLSEAAIELAHGGDPGTVDSIRADATAIARQLGGEVRPFPARSTDPVAIGAVCGRDEHAKFGCTQVKPIEPAKTGRRSFQFHLEEEASRVDRNALGPTTVAYEVTP